LFTDIEGSTRRWEADPEAMRVGLAAHDEVLRSTIESRGGWLFKHTGDGVCAAFSSAPDALAAAVDAQRRLGFPVRMGVVTGVAEVRDGDYFGPVLNRAARVMAAAHGGQIVLSAVTAGLAERADLVDLGVHRLRDVSGVERLFQVRADGLRSQFPPLRTIDAVPGNLPVQTTSFVGRDLEVKQLAELIRAHRLVTLTGVGGVGKTRLALQTAAGVTGEFPDGVWLVELAPVGDPAAVADAMATTLGIAAQVGLKMEQSIANALSGRRVLVMLDNCEHVIHAARAVVRAVLAGTSTVKVLATSREGLGLAGEHLWAVPSLGVDGDGSEAVRLFVDRATAVDARFSLEDPGDAGAVVEICGRLDGIALGIELAAARMVSMTPQDVRDRLDDRFRLLAGGRDGWERHQTLRHAVAWSYELLNDNERRVLRRCAVFAAGFDIEASAQVCGEPDEYLLLDVLESLVRKSLITFDRQGGHARYSLLETIRQFAEEQLVATDDAFEARDRHARHFAARAEAYWEIWDGPRQRVASEWTDVEFANLRVGFRWAVGRNDVVTATSIAAHTTMLFGLVLGYEAVGWAEELLAAATAADVRALPRLYTAASICSYIGRPEAAVGYAETARKLEADHRYLGFQPAVSRTYHGIAHLFAGQVDRCMAIWAEMAARPESGTMRTCGRALLTWLLPAVGRTEEARLMAEDAVAAARVHGNPAIVTVALAGYGRAFAETDPRLALDAYREGLRYCREHRVQSGEAFVAREAAGLEALHGRPDEAGDLFDIAMDAYLRSGDHHSLAITLAHLGVFFDRVDQPDVAATLHGATARYGSIVAVPGFAGTMEHVRTALGVAPFDTCVETGTAMSLAEAVAYAHRQIEVVRSQWGNSA
jgi:predicted ATPase